MSKALPKNFLAALELARGGAAFCILISHLILYAALHTGMSAEGWTPVAYALHVGVDVFFMISGFIMVHTTRQGSRHAGSFFLKRLIRIYPAYWAVTLVLIPVFLFRPEWVNSSSAEKPLLLHSLLLLPQAGLPLLMVAWTLVFEMYFYVLFAATMFLKPGKQIAALSVFMVLCAAAGTQMETKSAFLDLVTSPLLLEFMAGMILGWAWPKLRLHKALVVLCPVLAVVWLIGMPASRHTHFVAFAFPALMIMMAFLGWEKNDAGRKPDAAIRIGAVSYALYLVHVPIISGLPKIASLAGISLPDSVGLGLAFLASIVAAVILHYGLELPVQKFLRKHLRLKTHSAE